MIIKPISNKVLIESALEQMNKIADDELKAKQLQESEAKKAFKESEEIINLRDRAAVNFSRFTSFSESITNALLGDSIFHVFRKAMDENTLAQPGTETIMHAMVGDFIKEDSSAMVNGMRTKSATLSEMYNNIVNTKKKILEAETLDRMDPSTFRVSGEVKDEFFKNLQGMDTDSISDAIRERVNNAVDEFIEDNKKDHDRIMTTLQLTKDKLEEKSDAPEEVKESYEQMSRRMIGKIRNRHKSIFESMVSAMCESVMKHPEMQEEFAVNGKPNIDKIVDRIRTMYTFIETVNTMQLYKIDEEYMTNLIESLRK